MEFNDAEAPHARAVGRSHSRGQRHRVRAGWRAHVFHSGTVVDASGAVIPGANIVAKNNGTGAEYTTVSNEKGTFSIPALTTGTYTVTVSLMGFRTAVLNDVALTAAGPASVRAVLAVGGLEETVIVEARGSIVQTQSAAVATTLDVNQISNLPLTSRNALDFVVNLPGVNTPGGNRDSTINGLPQSAINITIDGMSAQDNYLKTSDGFFARVSPRLDSVEEVTVRTAAHGRRRLARARCRSGS